MKKTVLLILCILLLTGSVYGENYDVIWEGTGATCGDSLSWSLSGTTLYITGSGDMYDFSSGAPWMSYKDSITQVILSDTVTSVGAYAFQDYDALTYVYFGTSLVSIGKDAFSGCDSLTSVTLPSTFKKFGENCFRSCQNLTQINCSGGFPRFDENCLWDTYCTIVYSASNPWSVSLIQQLEEAFQGRIEFRSSDGTDPYTPTEATEATEAPTEETFWVNEPTAMYSTSAETQAETSAYTQPATAATTATTAATAAATVPATTQATIVLATEVTEPQSYSGSATDGSSIFGVLIVIIMLAILATGALLVRSTSGGGRKKKRKHRR